MTKLEIVRCIANNHNRLSQIMVNGDNAILMGDTIKEMRMLIQELQNDIEHDESSDKRTQKREEDSNDI